MDDCPASTKGLCLQMTGGFRPCDEDECLEDRPLGVHGSDGSLAYPDNPMPVNVQPLDTTP